MEALGPERGEGEGEERGGEACGLHWRMVELGFDEGEIRTA